MANAKTFDERLANAIAIADRRGSLLAILFLDLDGFKLTNDSYGHVVGDTVLREMADRLVQSCREEDAVCRCGGDAFFALLPDPRPFERRKSKHRAQYFSGRRHLSNRRRFRETLVRNADTAMYQAKINKSPWHFFDNGARSKVADPVAILKEMIEVEENNIRRLESEIGEELEYAAVLQKLQEDCKNFVARLKMAITEL